MFLIIIHQVKILKRLIKTGPMILKNDTSNVIEFNSSFSEDIKENKPRSFWKLFNKQ